MHYRVGRALQLVGLILLPVGMAGNIMRPGEYSLGYTLTVSGIGVAAFALGWLLQQAGGKP